MQQKNSGRDRYPDRSAYAGLTLELSDEDRNAYIASGKAISYLMKMENDGSCGLEKGSVYGAAVAIPQIARSAGWSGTMTALAIRSYMFLMMNIFIQGFLLCMIAEDEILGSAFAGKVHLCDFGAKMEDCPQGAPNCKGPGGTTFSAPRLYGFDVWSTRVYVRDSLAAIFPDRAKEIHELVDPGEYGLENYYCRATCCFIFMMAMMDDMHKTLSLAVLLWHVPSDNSKWVRYEAPEWATKEHAKRVHAWCELDLVKFGVAGMPFRWKTANFVFIFIPKMLIWWVLASLGMHFLMETAGIVDVIMNSMALTFIINLDEMIFMVLTTVPVKHMMDNLEDYALFELEDEEREKDDDILTNYLRQEFGTNKWKRFGKLLLPKRLCTVLLLLTFFIWNYYRLHCDELEDGSLVSKPLRLPTVVRFNPISFFTDRFPAKADAYWTMPTAS
mmetsp:Transcript_45858/g.116604  ORF Transcript_45858/g.116604 Transcript_45858/m.116604 type:complete len:444 (-) Transcript_45858:11-1342(-)